MPAGCVCCGREGTRQLAASVRKESARRRGLYETHEQVFRVCDYCDAHARELAAWREPSFSPECEARWYPAVYENIYGADHTFWFDSARYADAFAAANRAEKRTVFVDRAQPAPVPPHRPRPDPPFAPELIAGPAYVAPPPAPPPPDRAGKVLVALVAIPSGACVLLMIFAAIHGGPLREPARGYSTTATAAPAGADVATAILDAAVVRAGADPRTPARQRRRSHATIDAAVRAHDAGQSEVGSAVVRPIDADPPAIVVPQ